MTEPNTPSTATSTPKPVAVPTDYLWCLTVDQYHEMIRLGILIDGDPIELLEGLLVRKKSKKPSHSYVNDKLRGRVQRILPTGWLVKAQDPITLETSEPEPDLTVARGELDDYADRHPGPQDIAQLVEVADTSLARDRGWKKRIYARARIAVYWIVNLVDRQVEVYTQPSGPAEQPDYAQRQDFGLGDTLTVVLDGQEIGKIAIEEFLG